MQYFFKSAPLLNLPEKRLYLNASSATHREAHVQQRPIKEEEFAEKGVLLYLERHAASELDNRLASGIYCSCNLGRRTVKLMREIRKMRAVATAINPL